MNIQEISDLEDSMDLADILEYHLNYRWFCGYATRTSRLSVFRELRDILRIRITHAPITRILSHKVKTPLIMYSKIFFTRFRVKLLTNSGRGYTI